MGKMIQFRTNWFSNSLPEWIKFLRTKVPLVFPFRINTFTTYMSIILHIKTCIYCVIRNISSSNLFCCILFFGPCAFILFYCCTEFSNKQIANLVRKIKNKQTSELNVASYSDEFGFQMKTGVRYIDNAQLK